jgi:hypothetical protein
VSTPQQAIVLFLFLFLLLFAHCSLQIANKHGIKKKVTEAKFADRYNTVQFGKFLPTFRSNILYPSSVLISAVIVVYCFTTFPLCRLEIVMTNGELKII